MHAKWESQLFKLRKENYLVHPCQIMSVSRLYFAAQDINLKLGHVIPGCQCKIIDWSSEVLWCVGKD